MWTTFLNFFWSNSFSEILLHNFSKILKTYVTCLKTPQMFVEKLLFVYLKTLCFNWHKNYLHYCVSFIYTLHLCKNYSEKDLYWLLKTFLLCPTFIKKIEKLLFMSFSLIVSKKKYKKTKTRKVKLNKSFVTMFFLR